MITMGCDIGSLFSKAVVLDEDKLLASRLIRTTGNIAAEVKGLQAAVLQAAGLGADQIGCLVGTGNGADLVKGAAFTEDSLTCVGAAAGYYLPETRLCIDMGGQSITSVLINEEGDVTNFMRNDKCASGSGRFLEVMSNKLDLEAADIDGVVADAKRAVEISNQCGVFAESEVISHVNNGEPPADVLLGVCGCVARMVTAQGRRFGLAEHYTLTGGVAKVDAVTRIIRERLGGSYHQFPFDPQFAAAIGAALLGDSE